MVAKIVYSVLEGFITMSQEFFHQNKEMLLITIRILTIINGIQELSLIQCEWTDTTKIYSNIAQFVITNHLIVRENQYMLIYLFVVHVLINIVCFLLVFFNQNNRQSQYFLFFLARLQHHILIIPTWKVIIYQIQNFPGVLVYVMIILNFTMYIQYALWVGTCKQTQLIDFTGAFSHQSAVIEGLFELITITIVMLSTLQNDTCTIILIVKYLAQIYLNNSIINHNSLFTLLFNVIMIDLIISMKTNLKFIFFMVLLSFTIFSVLNLYWRFQDQYLISNEITLQKCQMLESLVNNKTQSQRIKFKLAMLQTSLIKIKQTSNLESLLEILQNKNNNKDSLIIKILCSYTSKIYPLRALIKFHQHYQSNNILHKSYIHVITNQVNKQLSLIQKKFRKKQEDSHLTISEFLIAQLKQIETLESLEQTIRIKLQLLEQLRLGFSNQANQQDSLKRYINQIAECKQLMQSSYDFHKYCVIGQINSDILSLRIMQLYIGIVMANMKKAIEIGKQINDLTRIDKQYLDNTISNQILLTNRSLIIQTSLIHEKGQLINYNKDQAANFFNSSLEYVGNYKYIYELMPNYIAKNHDELINKFITKGASRLMETGSQIFVRTPQNFIQSANLHIYNPLQMDDVTLYAILTQSSTYIDYVLFDQFGIILGMTQKFCNFLTEFSTECNSKSFNVNDIIQKGGHILHYIPSITQQLQLLQINIRNSQNYQLSNLRSFWEIPQNNSECVMQAQYFLNQLKQNKIKHFSTSESEEKTTDYIIDNIYINILDPGFQFQVSNLNTTTNKTMYKFTEAKQKVEISYILQIQKVQETSFFVIQIQDYRVADAATTVLSTSQNRSNAISISSMQKFVENIESESISSEGHQIQQIQVFNNLHQRLLVEKLLFDDPEIDCDGILDKNSSKQMNYSQNQSKTPFILTQRQTHRQLLSGQLSGRGTSQRTEFILPQLAVQEHVNKDYDIINQLERDMMEITHQLPEVQEQRNDEIKIENEHLDVDFISKSMKTSKDIEENFTINSKSNLLQSEAIRELIDLEPNLRLVANLDLLSYLLESVVAIIIIIIIAVLFGQFDTFQSQLEVIQSIKSLNYFVTSTYQMIQSKYLEKLGFYYNSPFLQYQLNNSLSEIFTKSVDQQFSLEIRRCFLVDSLATDFNFDTCFIYYGRLQDSQYSYFRNGILTDSSYNFSNIAHPTYFQEFIYDFIYKFYNYTNQLITTHRNIQLSDIFVTILVICLIIIIFIHIFLFKVVSSKSILKFKLISILSRLTQEDIIEQIASHTIIIDSWKSNQWKLYNFYDLQPKKSHKTIKENDNPKKQTRKNNTQQEYYRREKLLLFITGINLFFLLIFFISGFIFLLQLFQSYIPSKQINEKFLQFQLQIDQSVTLGQLIKTEPLLNNFRNATEQAEIIKLYFQIVENLPTLIIDIMNSILQNQMMNSQSIDSIMSLLNSDLCSVYNLYFCTSYQTNFVKYENESYNQLVKNGINGIASQIYSFSISEFQQENVQQAFIKDQESLKQTISQQLFRNIYLQYTIDVQKTLGDTQTLLLNGNSDVGNQIIVNLELYYLILGPCLIIGIHLISIFVTSSSKKEIQKYKYLLLMIPEYKLDNSVVKQKIVNIRTYFF